MSVPGRAVRIRKELETLLKDPPPGVVPLGQDSCDGDLIHVKILGPPETPYAGGVFTLDVRLGQRYPFEAPQVHFATKIFHPNIDEFGRICLDSLKLPPSGSWRPSLNLSQILAQIRILLAEPGLSDPLMKDIAELFKSDREHFDKMARAWTSEYAGLGSFEQVEKKPRLQSEAGGANENRSSLDND